MSQETTPKSVFVTGADSPLGRAVVRTLVKRGYKVTGATRNGSAGAAAIRADGAIPTYPDLSREGEIRSVLHMAKADFVVHVATQDLNLLPTLAYDYGAHSDVFDTVALVKACQSVGVKRVVYASFAFLYGDTGAQEVDETHALSRDNDFYKVAINAENALLKADVPAVVLRAGYLYGAHNPALDALHDAILRGRPVFDGTGVTSFVHVDDLASAIVSALEAHELAHKVYNIVDDAPLSFAQFTDALGSALGVGAPLRLPFVANALMDETLLARLAQSTRASNARAKAELGFLPAYPNVQAGIERMLLQWRAASAPTTPAPTESKDIVPA
jgi:nucleoside-diphosphate-sugar epimerase